MHSLSVLLLINSILLLILAEIKWNIFHIVSNASTTVLRTVLKKLDL